MLIFNSRVSQVKKNIAFLDLDIALYNGRLESTVHVKPTDRHQYFHYSSSYPEHTKRFIVFSQTLPTSRSCSCENDFQDHCIQMRSWFLKRLLIIKLRKWIFFPANLQNTKNEKGILFVVTYHTNLYSLNSIIRDNMYLLNMNEEVSH